MTDIQAEATLREMLREHHNSIALSMAHQALLKKIRRESLKPYSLDELYNMIGQPVWLSHFKYFGDAGWAGVVHVNHHEVDFRISCDHHIIAKTEDMGKEWAALPNMPDGIDS